MNLLSITSRFIQKKANEKFHGEMRSGLDIHDIVGSCKNLSNKPKMVFIQACRGKKVYSDDDVQHLLQSNSTFKGHQSFRTDSGSWYMMELCRIFNDSYKTKDLDSMIKDVEAEVMKRVITRDGRTFKQKPVTERQEWNYKVYFDLECQSTS